MRKINLPSNIVTSDGDTKLAENLLKEKKVIITYLRKRPTVDVVKKEVEIPAEEEAGIIPPYPSSAAKETKTIHKRIICSGIPYACLIAFLRKDDLYIGWSKRMEGQVIPEDAGINDMLEAVTKNDDIALLDLYKVLKSAVKDIEVPFSKKNGKIAAVIRALNDEIIVKGNGTLSKVSEVIPSDVVRRLKPFIEQAESAFKMKAANISREEK